MSVCSGTGRYGNQIIRSLALSIYCERFNLNIKYQNYNNIENLGIKLFIGKKIFRKTLKITDGNYFKYYRNKNTNFNVQSFGFFQTKKNRI